MLTGSELIHVNNSRIYDVKREKAFVLFEKVVRTKIDDGFFLFLKTCRPSLYFLRL